MRAPGYIKEFDALRAFAAFGVIFAHYMPLRGFGYISHLESRLGAVGVDMFFALSGFLITSILLNCKKLHGENPVQSKKTTLRQFYIRRFLRIMPLYYLVVALFCIFLNPSLREHLLAFITYTVNIERAFSDVPYAPLNHFWTLAVEEQFYIFWPFVILFTSPKVLLRICIGGAILSLMCRISLTIYSAPPGIITQFTPCCLEPLVLGAAWAIYGRQKPGKKVWYFLIGSGLFTAVVFGLANQQQLMMLSRTAYGMFFSTLIYVIAYYSGRRILGPLRWKPLSYLGRISYGIYVWHFPIEWLTKGNPVHVPEWMPPGVNRIADFLALVIITIVVSSLSWHLFEKPINALRKRFPYQRVVKEREIEGAI